MEETKPIVQIKDLVELHERKKFPIDSIYLEFKDYKWLEEFFEKCYQNLCAMGKIKHRELCIKFRHRPAGLAELSKFFTKKLGYKGLELSNYLRYKRHIPLLVIGFLVKECNLDFDKVQEQIAEMHMGKAIWQGNLGMKIIYTLHNSASAMNSQNITEYIRLHFGTKPSIRDLVACLRNLHGGGYLIKYKQSVPYYTLRGERHKWSAGK